MSDKFTLSIGSCNTNCNCTPVYSVVVPVFNSERILPELFSRLVSVMEGIGETFQIVFVEDCGSDHSWDILCEFAARDSRVTAIQLMANLGQARATLAGIAHAHGKFIVTLDDDLQHPPEEIPGIVRALCDNERLDVVFGVPHTKRHNLMRRIGSNIDNRLKSWLIAKDPRLRFTAFRAMRREVAEVLLNMNVPYPSLGPMLFTVAKGITYVIVRHDPRKEGRSGYTFRRLVKQMLSNLIGYPMAPLGTVATLGAIGLTMTFLLPAYCLIRYLSVGVWGPWWKTLLNLFLALSGFTFFAYALIRKYLFRITQTSTTTCEWFVRHAVQQQSLGGVERSVPKPKEDECHAAG